MRNERRTAPTGTPWTYDCLVVKEAFDGIYANRVLTERFNRADVTAEPLTVLYNHDAGARLSATFPRLGVRVIATPDSSARVWVLRAWGVPPSREDGNLTRLALAVAAETTPIGNYPHVQVTEPRETMSAGPDLPGFVIAKEIVALANAVYTREVRTAIARDVPGMQIDRIDRVHEFAAVGTWHDEPFVYRHPRVSSEPLSLSVGSTAPALTPFWVVSRPQSARSGTHLDQMRDALPDMARDLVQRYQLPDLFSV